MKKMILLLGLILGICNMGVTAFAEESLVEVMIDTRPGDKIYEGTENITLDVYDLTEWRLKRSGNEKEDKEFILNTYGTKENSAKFVQDENLTKINPTPISLDATGKASFTLPRYQNERDAAYLILSSGETKEHYMLPIVVYLPQMLESDSTREYTSFLFNCKYDTIPKPPPPTDTTSSTTDTTDTTTTTTTTKSTEPPITDSSGPRKDLPKTIGTPSGGEGPSYSGKELPSTNELIRNYCFLGLLLMIVGLVGLHKNKGEKNYEK
ncbi:pilin N-terminal domain-containing protein [Enterococcus sp.]|uniref:pilin N-terminal domain-containing protein n=1 Tax=Enterococcus sp. TaxID=35783 RepID=UPI00290D3806|nr:pilin N-terminal domain-containing protein [Enterococcus sp.]MDU5336186.1 pilin N-terminal domain-containing protein [Enterococcus sp.]